MSRSSRRRRKKRMVFLGELLSVGKHDKFETEVNKTLTSLQREVWRRAKSILQSDTGKILSPFELVKAVQELGLENLIENEATKAVATEVIFPIHKDGIVRPWRSSNKRRLRPVPPLPAAQQLPKEEDE